MDTEEYLSISGIQHFCFCPRQWALIHLEQQWSENIRTTEGHLEHRRAHESELKEKRDNLLTVRGLRVVSYRLRLSGVCDVVEFSTDPHGITLQNQPGLWKPFPVEYKHGSTKEIDADRVQLCAQAMALEEMLVCDVPQGALFYETTRRPPLDPINALLSFAYTLLSRECAAALEGVGLDPYVGFLHRARPGRTSLAQDLMEKLRSCYADRFVVSCVNQKILTAKHCQKQESRAVLLSDEGRRAFLTAWQHRKQQTITHPFLSEKIPWGLVPYIQALLLARTLRGDLERYPPFFWK